MNRNNGPISPLSMHKSSDSFASRYGGPGGGPAAGGTPNDVPYGGGPYGAARPGRPSPPGSQHPSSSTDMSRPSASSGSMRPPSSASSLGGRSDGRMGFGGPPSSRDSGRSTFRPESEDVLQRHYHVLKQYLASSLRDEKGNLKPNRARDKLLRLSVTQFMELSTDVYDELIRREDDRLQRVKDVPRYLLPKPNFHPKRNQARQKLSTLPIERFKQLATDVFYELERRIPRFGGGDIDRPISSNSHSRAPSRGGMRGPPPTGYRGPPPPGGPGRPPMGPGLNGMGPPQPGYQSFRPDSPGPGGLAGGRRPSEQSEAGSLGRPLPKTFQSNTIVPNKSTMVEDDDDDDEDHLGMDRGFISPPFSEAASPAPVNEKDKETILAHEAEIARLKQEMEGLETRLLDKDQEIERTRTSGQDRETDIGVERKEWYNLREELEQKVMDAQNLHDSMRNELEMLKRSKTQDELDIHEQHERNLENVRAQLDTIHDEKSELQRQFDGMYGQHESLKAQVDDLRAQNEDLQRQLRSQHDELDELRDQANAPLNGVGSEEQQHRIQILEEELSTQEKLTSEVRQEATLYLQEMRDLSRQNDYAVEQEERLAAQVSKLENDVETWRQRYAKVKAQNKSIRASTLGLGLQTAFDAGSLVRKEALVSQDGLVKDVDITRFQLAVDELLKSGRQTSTDAMLESVKQVTLCVASITSTIGTDGYPTPSPSPHSPNSGVPEPSVAKLKARVTGTANSLITATKQHASASGLSPVALLDAAASNLTFSVVELIKAVGIRPSLASELHDANDLDSFYGSDGTPSLDLERTLSLTAVVNPASSPPPPPPVEVKPAPLSVGRSNTVKKNGWFGWGGKSSVDETPAPPPLAGVQSPGSVNSKGEVDEYDPYR